MELSYVPILLKNTEYGKGNTGGKKSKTKTGSKGIKKNMVIVISVWDIHLSRGPALAEHNGYKGARTLYTKIDRQRPYI